MGLEKNLGELLELDFDIFEYEDSHDDSGITVKLSGSYKKWKVFELGGYQSYSNWSFKFKMTNLDGSEAKCEIFELIDCNYHVKQPRVQRNRSRVHFTTKKRKNGHDLKVEYEIVYKGNKYRKKTRLKN